MDSRVANETESGWAAGLFEGEGSIRYYRDMINLKLGMTDRDVVEKFMRVVGCGKIRLTKKAEPHHLQFYEWSAVRKDDVSQVMRLLLPNLGERRTARWNEVLALRAAAYAPQECPECKEMFTPIRRPQVCCGHPCAERYGRKVGKFSTRAPNKAVVENGYARPDYAARGRPRIG